MDIDDTENPFGDGVGNRGVDDDDENIPLISTSSRRGSEDTNYRSSHSRTHGETSFVEGIDEHTPLKQRENELNDSVDEIKRKFPNADTSKFASKIDEYGRVKVKLIREGGKDHLLFKQDGEVNEKLPKTIIEALGPSAEDIIRIKEEEISRREKKIDELLASRETASGNQREQIDADIEEQQNEISRLEAENERIEERMSLRDRVKVIFKKYGFTVFAVVSAFGLVIGVIVSNLKKRFDKSRKRSWGCIEKYREKNWRDFAWYDWSYCKFRFQNSGRSGWFSGEKRLVIDSRCGNVYD